MVHRLAAALSDPQADQSELSSVRSSDRRMRIRRGHKPVLAALACLGPALVAACSAPMHTRPGKHHRRQRFTLTRGSTGDLYGSAAVRSARTQRRTAPQPPHDEQTGQLHREVRAVAQQGQLGDVRNQTRETAITSNTRRSAASHPTRPTPRPSSEPPALTNPKTARQARCRTPPSKQPSGVGE